MQTTAPTPTPTRTLSQVHTGRLIPVTEWNEHHIWPRERGLRHLIFKADSNGFDAVVRRVGRRVLIDEAAFFAWVGKNGGRA